MSRVVESNCGLGVVTEVGRVNHCEPYVAGTRLADRYELIRVLGRGGEAITWLASDRDRGQQVALKIRAAQGEAARGPVDHETSMLRSLNPQRSLPVVIADFIDRQNHVMVMELIDGDGLDAMVAACGARPRKLALACLDDIAGALDGLHGQAVPIVHGDVKPANVMVTPDGRGVLIDFGIATFAGTPQPDGRGTPGYRAPEVVAGAAVTPAADIYGLAVTALAMLTGCLDPTASGPVATLGTAAAGVIRQALTTDPQHRPGSAGVFVADLRRALSDCRHSLSDCRRSFADPGTTSAHAGRRSRRCPRLIRGTS